MTESVVGTYGHRSMAEADLAVLRSADIPGRLAGDDAGGIAPHFGLGQGGVTLVVPTDRAEEAAALLGDAVVPGDDLEDPFDGPTTTSLTRMHRRTAIVVRLAVALFIAGILYEVLSP